MAKVVHNNSVTIAKAVGIILMVIGHAGCPQLLYHFVYLFHMPLFFFCSGLFFKPIYDRQSFLQYIKKKVLVLYIPFVKWSVLYLILHNVFMYLGIYNQFYGYEGGSSFYTDKDFIEKLVSIFFTMHDYEYVLGGFWFIRSLFLSTLFVSFVYVITRGFRNKKHGIICVCFFITTIFIRRFFPQTVFWHDISLGTLGGAFYLLGYVFTEKTELNRKHSFYIVSFCCILLASTFLYFKTDVSMACGWNKVTPYTVGAVSGTLLVLYVSNILNKCNCSIRKGLYYIGNHTYEILAMHIISFKVVSLLIINIYHMDFTHIAEHSVIANVPDNIPWWFFYSLAGVMVPLLLCKLYHMVKNKMKLSIMGLSKSF